jgi:hypothetical protein
LAIPVDATVVGAGIRVAAISVKPAFANKGARGADSFKTGVARRARIAILARRGVERMLAIPVDTAIVGTRIRVWALGIQPAFTRECAALAES